MTEYGEVFVKFLSKYLLIVKFTKKQAIWRICHNKGICMFISDAYCTDVFESDYIKQSNFEMKNSH